MWSKAPVSFSSVWVYRIPVGKAVKRWCFFCLRRWKKGPEFPTNEGWMNYGWMMMMMMMMMNLILDIIQVISKKTVICHPSKDNRHMLGFKIWLHRIDWWPASSAKCVCVCASCYYIYIYYTGKYPHLNHIFYIQHHTNSTLTRYWILKHVDIFLDMCPTPEPAQSWDPNPHSLRFHFNPSQKYARQIGKFPQNQGENKKYLKPPPSYFQDQKNPGPKSKTTTMGNFN